MKKLKLLFIPVLLAIAAVSFILAGAAPAGTTETEYRLINSEYVIEDYYYAVKVRGPDGNLVQIEDGKVLLSEEGVYTVIYPDRRISVNVITEGFEVQISVAESLQESYSAGSVITIPAATVTCDRQSFEGYTVKVLKDGQELKSFDLKTAETKQYYLSESGNYVITYQVTDQTGVSHSENISFTVEDVREIYYNALPSSAAYGTQLNVGFPYGFYKGVNYAVEVKVLTPAGTEEVIRTPYYTVNRLGAYVFTYTSSVEGENLQRSQRVVCENQPAPFTFVTGGGEVSEKDLPQNVFDTDKTSGVLVKSDDLNVKFYYNTIIDLNDIPDRTGGLLEFLPYSQDGEYVSEFRVTITDVYDPSRVVGLRFVPSSYDVAHSYVIVEYKGLTRAISNDPRDAYYGTVMQESGTTIYNGSFRSDQVEQTRLFDLQYDIAEQRINFYGRFKDYTYGKQIILDLDDPVHVGLENVFEGFTTGEVIIGFELINNQGGGVYIVSVGGQPVSDSGADESSLIVCVNESTQLLSGAAGYRFKLPEVSKSVLISDSEPLELNIVKGDKNYTDLIRDGYFWPEETGVYEFVYSTNFQGTIVEKTLEVTIVEDPVPVVIGDITAPELEYYAYNKLPEAAVSGGTGAISVTTSVTCGGTPVAITESGLIYVTRAETYTVSIVAEDSVGVTAEKTYEMHLKPGAGIVFGGELPASVRAGQEVTLPSYRAYIAEEGMITFTDDVIMEIDGQACSDNTFTVPADSQTVTVVYKVNMAQGYQTVSSAEISVLSAIQDSSDVFVADTDEYAILESGVAFRYDGSASESEVRLANKIAGKNIYFRFAVNDKYAAFDSLEVTVQDVSDPTKKIVVSFSGYSASAGTVNAVLNGEGMPIALSGVRYTYGAGCGNEEAVSEYGGSGYTLFEFYVDIDGRAVKNSSGNSIIYIENFEGGGQITGLSGEVALVSFGLTGVTGESDLVIGGVANQQFSYNIEQLGYTDNDNMGPELIIFGQSESVRTAINSQFTVARAIGLDVIQSSCFTRVTVTAPDNTTLINNQTADTERTIDLTQYGAYRVVYTSTDNAGNRTARTITVNVIDEEAPSVAIDGQYAESYSLNDEITVLSASASDNNGIALEFIHVQNSEGYQKVSAGDTLKLTVSGSYRITYWAEDIFGNVTRILVAFDVK